MVKGQSKIETLNRVKLLVSEFLKEIERVEQYADPKGGVAKLLSSMEEIILLQSSIETKRQRESAKKKKMVLFCCLLLLNDNRVLL
jgi:hypothetical protein